MISPLTSPLVTSAVTSMMLFPVAFISGDAIPANAKRNEDGIPIRDEHGNYILAL